MVGEDQLGFELVVDDWAERLSREFAVVLFPYLKEPMTLDDCRALGGRLATLAGKRACEAGKLGEAVEIVSCCSCKQRVDAGSTASICPTCSARLGSGGDVGG